MRTRLRSVRGLMLSGLGVITVAVVVVFAVTRGDDAPTGVADPPTSSLPSSLEAAPTTTTGVSASGTTTAKEDTTPVAVSPTTTATLAPRTTASATPEDPVPPGEVIEFEGVWDIAIDSVDLDAAEYVVGLNDINPAPQPGFRYVLVDLVGTYLGERTAEPVFEWSVAGRSATYLPSVPGCGVLPDSLYDIAEIAPGDRFRGSICIPVRQGDIGQGLLLTLQLIGDEPKYFRLD